MAGQKNAPPVLQARGTGQQASDNPACASVLCCAGVERPPVLRIVVVQAGVTCLLAAVFFIFSGFDATALYSSLLGGSVVTASGFYLMYNLFFRADSRSAQSVVRGFYRGEAGKFALTCVGFSLVFLLVRPLNALALLGTFTVVQAVNWFTPVLLDFRTG
ncbi:MAG: ATP synthase subunit I [Kistimonas sp.]|nr:ATP synthase subunit I [Kistimonas sp.]